MTRSKKILLGLASLWPFIYIVFFFLFVIGMIFLSSTAPGNSDQLAPGFGLAMIAVFVLHFFTIVLSLVLTVLYIIHVIKNDAIKSDMKAMWAVLFFFGGIIAEPIYWYLYIWKEAPLEYSVRELSGGDTTKWSSSWNDAPRDKSYAPPNEPPDWR